MLPRETVMVQESSTTRTARIPFGHEGLAWTRSGGGSLRWGVGAAIGAKIAVGHARPVVLHLGDGALAYDDALQDADTHDRVQQRDLPDRAPQLGEPDARHQDGARRQVPGPLPGQSRDGLCRARKVAGRRRRGRHHREGPSRRCAAGWTLSPSSAARICSTSPSPARAWAPTPPGTTTGRCERRPPQRNSVTSAVPHETPSPSSSRRAPPA